MVPFLSIPLAHASTFVGYASNTTTCGTCFFTAGSANFADGLALVAPLTGQLISVSIRTSQSVPASTPTSIVIATFAMGANPATTPSAGCNNACGFVNSGQSFTVQDVETVSLSQNLYQTVALASPVSVTANQWIGLLWMGMGTANAYLELCSPCNNAGDPPITTAAGLTLNIGSTSPTVGTSYSSNANNPGGGIIGGTFQATGTTGQTITLTQCYGNCGLPPITLVNTNSTHSVNFNQSITLLYEFQSNLNGFLLNVTTNQAKSYLSNQNGPNFGVYTIASCPLGQLPFSTTCPGILQTRGGFSGFAKGKVSLSSLKIPVSNGQWVGIAMSASFSPFDVNDTNTNVLLSQTNEGNIPTTIQQATPGVTSKVGLWAWIVGNVVTGQSPTSPSGQCTNFGFLDCFFTNLINSFCSNLTTACQTSSAIFWAIIFTIIAMFTLGYGEARVFGPNHKFSFVSGELGFTFFLGFILLFAGLTLVTTFVVVFFIMVITLGFSKSVGRFGF